MSPSQFSGSNRQVPRCDVVQLGRINHADVRSADSVGDLPTAPIELRADPKIHVSWAGAWSTCGRHRDMDAVATVIRFGAVGLVAATLLRGGSSSDPPLSFLH